MNLLVLVEGESASRRIYKTWIPYVNKKLVYINGLDEYSENNFYVLAGKGQPGIMNIVEQAVLDANSIEKIDRLVIAMDSENLGQHERYLEVRNRVDRIGCNKEVRYIIQHFCLETWLLAHDGIHRRRPSTEDAVAYRKYFDLRKNDPELLPGYPENNWLRAQFAYQYLRAAMADVNYSTSRRITYSKFNPGGVIQEPYFRNITRRMNSKVHIQSFNQFHNAFI